MQGCPEPARVRAAVAVAQSDAETSSAQSPAPCACHCVPRAPEASGKSRYNLNPGQQVLETADEREQPTLIGTRYCLQYVCLCVRHESFLIRELCCTRFPSTLLGNRKQRMSRGQAGQHHTYQCVDLLLLNVNFGHM